MSTINIPKRILKARRKHKLSLRQAAKQWGFAQSTLAAWESGNRNPAGLYREKLESLLSKMENGE